MEGTDPAIKDSTSNYILQALPEPDRARLLAQMEQVHLSPGTVIAHPDDNISHAYFPSEAMISVVAYSEEGQGSEIAVIGFEGLTAIEAVLGARRSTHELVTQLPRSALRIPIHALVNEFRRSSAL